MRSSTWRRRLPLPSPPASRPTEGLAMVKRLDELPEGEARHLRRVECPTYDDTPAIAGRPLAERRVVIISTAGLHKRGDRPFRPGDGSYRVIPAETAASE